MNRNYLVAGLIVSATFLLSGCSNTSPLTETNFPAIPTKVIPVTVAAPKPAATVIVDWQKIEALADKKYQDELLPDYILDEVDESNPRSVAAFYARDVGVSIPEAHRRLILQAISGPLIEAIEKHLDEALVGAYYEINNLDEFAIKLTTLTTVEAIPPKYIYHFKQKEFKDYSLPIYIQASSDKTETQILALQEQAIPEILKRYPDTQGVGYSPITNTINVYIYNETPDENERKRIEGELTKLVGHPVKVEFQNSRIQVV